MTSRGRRGPLTAYHSFAKVERKTLVERDCQQTAMMKWLRKQMKMERRTLERARRRFLRKPSQERLHHVRTSSRRLRSLLEDTSELAAARSLVRAVKRTAKSTDAARDAAVIRALLERTVGPDEVHHAQSLLADLRLQERHAIREAVKRLRRLHYPA